MENKELRENVYVYMLNAGVARKMEINKVEIAFRPRGANSGVVRPLGRGEGG